MSIFSFFALNLLLGETWNFKRFHLVLWTGHHSKQNSCIFPRNFECISYSSPINWCQCVSSGDVYIVYKYFCIDSKVPVRNIKSKIVKLIAYKTVEQIRWITGFSKRNILDFSKFWNLKQHVQNQRVGALFSSISTRDSKCLIDCFTVLFHKKYIKKDLIPCWSTRITKTTKKMQVKSSSW